MLQKFNDRIRGVVAWVIVILVTVTFTLFGLDYYLQARRASDVKVQVNGQVISKHDFDLNYRRVSQTQDPSQLDEKVLKQQVLSDMIANTVRLADARSQGFDVDARQASAAIVSIPQFQEDGHFSTSRYTQALSNTFFTPQTFQQEVRQGMLLNQQRFAFIGTAFVLPNELNQFVTLALQTRDYDYAVIKAADFKSKVTVTDEDIRQYYQTHQTEFFTKEQVSIDYVRLSLAEVKKTIRVTPEQVLRHYEDNKNDYLTPAQWDLAYLRFPVATDTGSDDDALKQQAKAAYEAMIADPQHFKDVAKPFVAEHAQLGEMLHVSAGQSDMDHDLVNLTAQGQIAPPVRLKDGYYVLQVLAYRPAIAKPFTEVRALISEQLLQEAAQQRFSELEDRLSDLSYQNPDSLAPVAKALHLPVLHTSLFSRDKAGKEEMTQHPVVVQTAFGHDVLEFGNNSEIIQIDADSIMVLRVNQHRPAALQGIAQVQPMIVQILLQQKAIAAAAVYGEEAIAHPNAALSWREMKAVGRDADAPAPLNAEINELAFAIPKIAGYAGHTLHNGDFAVVRLKKITEGRLDPDDKEQLATISQQVESNFGLIDYDLYMAQLMAQAKIVNH